MKNKSKIIILFSIFYFLFSSQAMAAKLELNSPVSEIGTGQQFKIDLMLDAENEDINAVEGIVAFSPAILELKSVKDGDSIINFWIEKPNQKEAGRIKFSGIVPGGFRGILGPYWEGYKPGKVFSLIFAAKSEGGGAVEIKNAKVLLNDGQGTPANVQISNFQFNIKDVGRPYINDVRRPDIDPPELFAPEVASNPNIFGGKWFLVFAAQDKISGIDHYELQETPGREPNKNNWHAAESPFLLKDQSLSSYIFVKAVDRSGNSRIVYLPPKVSWYQKPIVYIPIIFIALIGVIIIWRWIRKLWRQKTEKYGY